MRWGCVLFKVEFAESSSKLLPAFFYMVKKAHQPIFANHHGTLASEETSEHKLWLTR